MNIGAKCPDNKNNNTTSTSLVVHSVRARPDEYPRAVSKISVAQICQEVGFSSCQDSALESLSDIAIRYIKELGKITASYSNISNRTECNVFDLLKGLEDLGFSSCSRDGDSGSSSGGICVPTGSGVIRDFITYVGAANEVPFAQSLPRFPVIRDRKDRMVPSFMDMGESPSGSHIPPWLPVFPDPHTYIHTPVWSQRQSDPRADKIEQARQRRKAERSLLSLQQRLMSSGSVGVGPSGMVGVGPSAPTMELSDGNRELQVNGNDNPFLATPVRAVDNDVAMVDAPDVSSEYGIVDRNPVSLLDAFAPVIEAAEGGVWEVVERQQNGVGERMSRPTVSFKFGSGKKLLGGSSSFQLRNKNMGKQGPLLGRDEERDDKKRRAQLIIKQSMENPQELNQL